MNPWVDVLGWAIVLGGVVVLWFEVPRAVRTIQEILREERAIKEYIERRRKR